MPTVVYTPADIPERTTILPPRHDADATRARALLARVRPDLVFRPSGGVSPQHEGSVLLAAPDWMADVARCRAAGFADERILVMPELELGWPLAEWSYSYWAVPLDYVSRRANGTLRLNYHKFLRMLIETKALHGEFHGQHLCDGYKAGTPSDAPRLTEVLNMLGDEASRVDYLTILFGEPVQVWQNWCQNLYNHLEYMDYAMISPGDVILNCGVLGGSEIPLFLAALDGRGTLVNVDPFGYDHCLGFTRKAMANCPGIDVEIRVAAFNREGTIRLPIWHGMAMGGMAGKSMPGFPEQDFPCRAIDAISRDLALSRLDYLKMDIEGGEIAALEGAAETIKRFRPQLAISIYHERHHYWQIPLMLAEMCPDYRFFVKHYHYNCAETLFYAVPKERPVRPRRTMISARLE